MYIKTDREYYYPGNVVYGKIYIRFIDTGSPFELNPNYLEIRVKGKEKAKITYFHEEDEETIEERKTFKRELIDYKGSCHTF